VTPAQLRARASYNRCRGWAEYTGDTRVLEMRNAWVAYHAGAPWMCHPVSVGSLILQTTRENARLRADVERIQEEAEAWARTAGGAAKEVAAFRADVERLERLASHRRSDRNSAGVGSSAPITREDGEG